MKSLKWTYSDLRTSGRRHFSTCRALVLAMLGWSTISSQAVMRIWTGESGISSYWRATGNWYGGYLPSGYAEDWYFDSNGLRRQNTNDLLSGQMILMGHVYLQAGGYSIYGNPLGLPWITADYAAGGNCTLGFTFLGGSAEITTPSSTLTFTGDMVLTNWGFDVSGAGDCVVSGVISGTNGVRKESSGYLTFQGPWANTFTGTTSVQGGTLRLNKTFGGLFGRVSVPGDLVIGSGTNGLIGHIVLLEFYSQIADTAAVSIFASGQLDLNNYNDTIGPLTMTGGSVVTGIGTLTLNGDVYGLPAANVASINGNLALGSATERRFDVASGAQMEVDAVISGGSGTSLVKTNSGGLILTAANTYSGPTVIAGGSLTVMNSQALGSSTNGTTLQNGVLHIDDASVSNEVLLVTGLSTLQGSGTCGWWGDVTLNHNLTVDAVSGATLTLGGVLSGDGGFTKTYSGTLRLNGASPNTFTGDCNVWSGTLELNKTTGPAIPGKLVVGDSSGGPNADVVRLLAAHQLSDTNHVSIASSGWLDLNGYAETIGGLDGSGLVSLGAGRLTVSNQTDFTYSGSITGANGGLTKSGPATLTLNGTNVYSGLTTISNGTLCVNGVISNSTVSLVATGSVLSGTGQVQSISVAKGTVSPGSSAGILTCLGTVSLAPGTLTIELNGTNAGTGYDQLRALGTVTLDKATLNASCAFSPPAGTGFTIIDKVAGGAVAGTFNGLPEGKVFAVSGLPFQISYVGGDGNDVVLTRVRSSAVTNLTAQFTNNQVLIRAQGIAGLNYVIEAAPNLVPPVSWQLIATNTADGTGVLTFTESDPSLYPQRFYRIASP